MPTGVYDPGTPPEPWDIDLNLLPVYPGAKQFGSKYMLLTPDPYPRVTSFYKEKLPDAETTETPGSAPSTIFSTELFTVTISVGEGGINTLITFSRPKK